jgi:hypothetical protein
MRVKVLSNNPVMLHLQILATGSAILAIKASERGKSNTVYLDRKYGSVDAPVSGKIDLKLPMPDKFEKLAIEVKNVLNSSPVKIHDISHSELPQREIAAKQVTKDYIRFAADFARKCGYLPTDNYQSKDGKFQIHLLDRIRDHKTGEIVPTPARVNHMSGIIEVSKKDFAPMTVANRLYILMHEYAHFANNTDDEVECDMLAAKTCMELGYSAIECLYAVSKLFMYNSEYPANQRAEQEQRVKKVKDFINQFGQK